MANTITKFQTQYLQDRLNQIKREKVSKFIVDNKVEKCSLFQYYYDLIKAGKLKLKSAKEFKYTLENTYHCSPDIVDLFDCTEARKNFDKDEEAYDKKRKDYEDKLEKAITSIVDSVVLQGLGIDEAIARFMKL